MGLKVAAGACGWSLHTSTMSTTVQLQSQGPFFARAPEYDYKHLLEEPSGVSVLKVASLRISYLSGTHAAQLCG